MENVPVRVRGFSLVELIITLLIIGILSVVVIGRFTEADAFDGTIIQNQLVAVARVAQQSALGRPGVYFQVQPNGSEVSITASDSNGEIQGVTVPGRDVVLSGDMDETASCSVTAGADTITNVNPLIVHFGALGDIESAGVGTLSSVTSAIRICVNDTPAVSVCISPSGFAYTGDCDG